MKINELLGTEFPIIQGGMANIATGAFAAAVSNAGALGLIGAFQVFSSAYIISNGSGGPAGMTNFITLYLYKRGFSDGQMGYASAIAWVLLIVVAILAFILFRTQKSWVHYSGDSR